MRTSPVILALVAGQAVQAQAPIAAHPLGAVVATASIPFGRIEPGQVVTLDDGRPLVADGASRIVWLFDRSLANPLRVLDSVPGKATTFSVGSFIVPYRGDTALMYDRAAGALVTIGPDGALGRTFAGPPARALTPAQAAAAAARPATAPTVPGFSDYFALPVTSSAFGLIYRTQFAAPIALRMSGAPRLEDSMIIARMEIGSRRVDTLARLVAGPVSIHLGGAALSLAGAFYPNQPLRRPELLPFADEAAVTTDGSIAILHGHEYRLEWISGDGSRSSTRLTFPWRHLSDDERRRFADSLNASGRSRYDSALAKRAADSARTGAVPMTTVTYGGGRQSQMPISLPRAPTIYIAEDVPEYFPPIEPGGMLADRDNNVWIRPVVALPDPTGVVWDVINRKSELVERVRVPTTATIVGFGPGGFVYLTARDAGKLVLQKVRVGR